MDSDTYPHVWMLQSKGRAFQILSHDNRGKIRIMADVEHTDNKTLPDTIHNGIVTRLSCLDTAKQNRTTEQIISAAVDTYIAINPGANNISASADKSRKHLEEEHGNIALQKAPRPALDLHMTGGKRDLSVETELGDRPKLEAADLAKLRGRPNIEDKIMVTRTTSSNSLGRFTDTVAAASKNDGGNYIHVEIHMTKDAKANTAKVRTSQYTAGTVTYDIGSIETLKKKEARETNKEEEAKRKEA